MLKTKVIMSKRQTDFQNQVERFIKSLSGSDDRLFEEIHYAISADGNDVWHSALIEYDEFRREES